MALPRLEGVCIAPTSDTLETAPVWVRLDNGNTRVASYTIDRGRQYELDMTDGGRAEVKIWDEDGYLDPTNPTSPLYGTIEPLIQAGIGRWNPVLNQWETRFRGFIDEYDYDFNPAQNVNELTLTLVDIFEILETCEMHPGAFGDSPPLSVATSDIFFDNVATVGDRVEQVMGNAGIPADFYIAFSGNVSLYETTYAAGSSVLSVIQECVDAEFPAVANFYTDRHGRGVFHGRNAKFTPLGVYWNQADPDNWEYIRWRAGDGAYVDASPTTRAQIREFGFARGASKIINSALCTPMWIDDADIAGQLVTDATSIGKYGIRSWSRQNLVTKTGMLSTPDATANEETALFAQYMVDNYKQPHNRVTRIGFRPLRDTDPRAAYLWDFLCRVDISHSIKLTVGSPGGGGFDAETDEGKFFVEGVHEEVVGKVGGSNGIIMDDVTITLDLSPMTLYTTNPWPPEWPPESDPTYPGGDFEDDGWGAE